MAISKSTLHRRRNRPTLEQIHESQINGNKVQTVDQIRQYGISDFFMDYSIWLYEQFESGDGWNAFRYYTVAVNWYHGQRRRVRHDG